MRYNLLEKRALEESNVREFVFASGNLSERNGRSPRNGAAKNAERVT
jgi:hypothetical protein